MKEHQRITFEVSDELKARIKSHAALRNVSVRKMITRWLLDKLAREEAYLKKEGGKS